MIRSQPSTSVRALAALGAVPVAVLGLTLTASAGASLAGASPPHLAAGSARAVAVHTVAAARVRVVPDRGYTITRGRRDYVGSYRTTGTRPVRLWCVNPYSTSPSYVTLGASSRLEIHDARGRTVRLSAVTQARLSYLLTTYGDLGRLSGTTAKRHRAAAVSQAVNTVLGNTGDVKRRARALPAVVRAQTTALVRATTAYAGPYRIRFGSHPALAVGQRRTTTVQLVAHSGRAVPRQRFTLVGSGAAVTRTVTADRRGTARITYSATSTGWVRVSAHAVTPGPSLVASGLQRGVQRLIGAGARGAVKAGFAVHRSIRGARVGYTCTSTCDGRPVEAVTQCTEAGTAPAAITVYDGSRVVSTGTLRRSGSRACLTQRVTVADGHTLRVTIRYDVGGRWTPPVSTGSVIIDCPPPPVVQLTQSCACVTGVVTATLRNTTDHAEAIVVDGAMHTTQGGRTVSTVVRPGRTLTLRFSFSTVHERFVLAVRGAAQRRTGTHWNLGTTTRVSIGG